MIETMANGYSSDSPQWGLSNEMVNMIFINFCFFMHWMKEASALEGLITVQLRKRSGGMTNKVYYIVLHCWMQFVFRKRLNFIYWYHLLLWLIYVFIIVRKADMVVSPGDRKWSLHQNLLCSRTNIVCASIFGQPWYHQNRPAEACNTR